MAYDWKSLRRWLARDPECKCCDNKKLTSEIDTIIKTAKAVSKARSTAEGCISISNRLAAALRKAFPRATPAIGLDRGTAPGAFGFWTTVTRTWWEFETDCYRITTVAWWSGPFRHQAVLRMPKCYKGDEYRWWGSTVIDLYWAESGVWRPWHKWAGGKGAIDKSCGRVRHGF